MTVLANSSILTRRSRLRVHVVAKIDFVSASGTFIPLLAKAFESVDPVLANRPRVDARIRQAIVDLMVAIVPFKPWRAVAVISVYRVIASGPVFARV